MASYRVPLSDDAWASYDRDGFIVVDGLADAKTLQALNERLDALMDGSVRHGDALLMQLDPSSPEVAAAGAAVAARGGVSELDAYAAGGVAVAGQSVGWKGPSRAYRKVGEAQAGLEVDPVFSAWMRGAPLRAIAERVYGAHAPVAVYRAMAMCKPAGDAGGGTALPWHQDGGAWWALDRDPLVFVWLALSRATAANGAVQVVRGSHRRGLLSARGHTLSPAVAAAVCAPRDVVDVELAPGQAFICHNWTVHRSGVNTTAEARRGLSVNFIDARTRVLAPKPPLAGPLGAPGSGFPIVWPARFADEDWHESHPCAPWDTQSASDQYLTSSTCT